MHVNNAEVITIVTILAIAVAVIDIFLHLNPLLPQKIIYARLLFFLRYFQIKLVVSQCKDFFRLLLNFQTFLFTIIVFVLFRFCFKCKATFAIM